jgi:hypothetical protein
MFRGFLSFEKGFLLLATTRGLLFRQLQRCRGMDIDKLANKYFLHNWKRSSYGKTPLPFFETAKKSFGKKFGGREKNIRIWQDSKSDRCRKRDLTFKVEERIKTTLLGIRQEIF